MILCLLEKHYGSVVGNFDNTNEKQKSERGRKKEKKRKQKETWPQASGPREHPCPRFGDYTPDSLYIIHQVILAERAEEPQPASRRDLLSSQEGSLGGGEGLLRVSVIQAPAWATVGSGQIQHLPLPRKFQVPLPLPVMSSPAHPGL